MLEVHDPEHEIESQINMEIEENTARQAQRQMRQVYYLVSLIAYITYIFILIDTIIVFIFRI